VALNLKHQTGAQFAARFWQKLRATHASGNKIEFARMVWWLYGRVQAGDFTTNEVRLSFNAAYGRNLTAGQWATFVSGTLAPIRDRYQVMLDQADL
jgi:hypothetical protein